MSSCDVTVHLPVAAQEVRLTVRTKGVRVFGAQCRLLSVVMKVAAWVAPCELELVPDKPPIRFHLVTVEKVGSDIRLVVGDRAVRLTERDAGYVGELLTARMPGFVVRGRADDPTSPADGGEALA